MRQEGSTLDLVLAFLRDPLAGAAPLIARAAGYGRPSGALDRSAYGAMCASLGLALGVSWASDPHFFAAEVEEAWKVDSRHLPWIPAERAADLVRAGLRAAVPADHLGARRLAEALVRSVVEYDVITGLPRIIDPSRVAHGIAFERAGVSALTPPPPTHPLRCKKPGAASSLGPPDEE